MTHGNTMRRLAAMTIPELMHAYAASIALVAILPAPQRVVADALRDLSEAIELELFTRAADGNAEIGAALRAAASRARADLEMAGVAAALNPSMGNH